MPDEKKLAEIAYWGVTTYAKITGRSVREIKRETKNQLAMVNSGAYNQVALLHMVLQGLTVAQITAQTGVIGRSVYDVRAEVRGPMLRRLRKLGVNVEMSRERPRPLEDRRPAKIVRVIAAILNGLRQIEAAAEVGVTRSAASSACNDAEKCGLWDWIAEHTGDSDGASMLLRIRREHIGAWEEAEVENRLRALIESGEISRAEFARQAGVARSVITYMLQSAAIGEDARLKIQKTIKKLSG